MAKISLRHYIREVENLIDQGQTEEAIAHSKYILQNYPKYVDAYRLLGKGYLESEKYQAAADLFQRVLACIPDDLVSHIGMSIVRETQDDLDGAIWHMERAYDLQPSNPAVQEELRRLYGSRDGEEPMKIRLSRGALVRMYARGNLYQQAITEIRNGLKEEPERYDLLVLLARMVWLTGSKVEAAETCTSLLNQYPYCLEANRILIEILPETSHAEDVQTFRDRVFALDPYAQFISPASPSIADVPDQSVMLERLQWYPGLQETSFPAPLRQEVERLPEASPLTGAPDWLLPEIRENEGPDSPTAGLNLQDEPADFFAGPSAPAFSDILASETNQPLETTEPDTLDAQDALIPDWMKGAGWTVGTGEAEEAPAFAEEPEDDGVESAEIFAADLPDWIQSLAPKDQTAASADEFVLPEIDEEIAAGFSDLKSEEILQDIPDWLNPVLESGAELPVETQPDEAVLDENISFDRSVEPAQPLPRAEEIAFELSPVDETTPPAELEQSVPEAGLPIITDQLDIKPEPEIGVPEREEIPSPDDRTIAVQDETSAWLENLAAIYGSDKETLIARPEDRLTQPPAWIREEETGAEDRGAVQDLSDENKKSGTTFPFNEMDSTFPAWFDELPAEEDPDSQSPSLLPKIEGWKLEFTTDEAAHGPSAQQGHEIQEPDPSSINGPSMESSLNIGETSLPPETVEPSLTPSGDFDIDKLVEEVLPDWMDEIKPAQTAALTENEMKGTPGDGTGRTSLQMENAAPVDENQQYLEQARSSLMDGNVAAAVDIYNRLIESGKMVDTSIQDLQQALYRYPVDPALWETLGNAYAQNNQLQDALDAYTKAEELVR